MSPRTLLLPFALVAALNAPVAAEPTSESGASILVFPHVVNDRTLFGPEIDTVIHIANTANLPAHVRCFYVANVDAECMFSGDFAFTLTRQQPLTWVVSSGRSADLTQCSPSRPECYGAGADPGSIPPTPTDPFAGALFCIQVDPSLAPWSGNSLQGLAGIRAPGGTDIGRYNAIGLRGLETNNGDAELLLGGPDAEYDGCPERWSLNHVADAAEDELIGPGSEVETRLIAVPCSLDFALGSVGTASVDFAITNEFETTLDASRVLSCSDNQRLSEINANFNVGILGSVFARTSMTHPGGPGMLLVAEEVRRAAPPGTGQASSLSNLHFEGERPDGDVIVLPPF